MPQQNKGTQFFLFQFPLKLFFPAYKEEDILAILEQRLGKKAFDYRALQLISRKVAELNGDMSKALEVTSNAVDKCRALLSIERQSMNVEDDELPLVKLPHMMRAIRESMSVRHAEVIGQLPKAAKVILCICVTMSQVLGPTAAVSISDLRKCCIEASHHAIMGQLSMGHIKYLVEMLIGTGLLLHDIRYGPFTFNPHDMHAKLKIGVQLDDVEIALEESLLTEGSFYQGVANYMKRDRRAECFPYL